MHLFPEGIKFLTWNSKIWNRIWKFWPTFYQLWPYLWKVQILTIFTHSGKFTVSKLAILRLDLFWKFAKINFTLTMSTLWVGKTALPRRWYCIARSLSSDSLVLIHKMMILLMLLHSPQHCQKLYRMTTQLWMMKVETSFELELFKNVFKKARLMAKVHLYFTQCENYKKICHPDFMWNHFLYIFRQD